MFAMQSESRLAPTIPEELISHALKLTGKTIEDGDIEFHDIIGGDWGWYETEFSYPKFFYYLLSPEFIEKYKKMDDKSKTDGMHETYYVARFGRAIYEYQRRDEKFPEGNPEPLISLLSKI